MEDFYERFGGRNMTDVVEFNKLKQENSAQAYQIKFEELSP